MPPQTAILDRQSIPLPPIDMRRVVGPTDPVHWDLQREWALGAPAVNLHVPLSQVYSRIFDFGCGAGRQARQLLMQPSPVESYLGIDISMPLIAWCQENIGPLAPHFRFEHHDVWSPTYAPNNTRRDFAAFPSADDQFTLVNAHSVFTHLMQGPTEFYLRELYRVLAPGGVCRLTCFLFNRAVFPVLAPHQHCLYVNELDATQAVYFDWDYFSAQLTATGFKLVDVEWSPTPGFHNDLWLVKGTDLPDRLKNPRVSMPPSTVLGY